MEEWRIHKDRTRCDKPGCPLAGESEFYAILRLPECVRVERCRACFAELGAGGGELPFHWKVRRDAGAAAQPTLDLEALRRLFDRLGEEPEPEDGDAIPEQPEANGNGHDAAGDPAAGDPAAVDPAAVEPAGVDPAGLRYMVALLLLRKRRLKMVDPTTPEQEAADLLVVDPKVAEMDPVALFAPELDADRLGGLREELMAALGE